MMCEIFLVQNFPSCGRKNFVWGMQCTFPVEGKFFIEKHSSFVVMEGNFMFLRGCGMGEILACTKFSLIWNGNFVWGGDSRAL